MDPSKLDEGPKLWPDGSSSSSSGRGIMTGSDHFGFLIYVSWKMMGWVLVMAGVLLALRCLRMWLLSAWIRETGLDSQLRIQCAAAAAAVSSSSNNNRSWLLGGGGGDSRDPERQLPRTGDDSAASNSDNEQASPVSDRPPKYEEVVQVSTVTAGSASGDPGQSSDGNSAEPPSCGCKEDADDQTQQQSTSASAMTLPNSAQVDSATTIQWDDEQEPPSYYELFKDA